MANRNIVVGAIWADGAPDVLDVPAPGVTYADSGLTPGEINTGWPFSEIAASNKQNEIMRRLTALVIDLEKQGILSYSVLTNYAIGAFVLGSNSIQYKALVANGPNTSVWDPVGNPTKWQSQADAGSGGGVTTVSTGGLATGGPITGTGTVTVTESSKLQAETGTNQTTAMSPLRVAQAMATLDVGGGIATLIESGDITGVNEFVLESLSGYTSFILMMENIEESIGGSSLLLINVRDNVGYKTDLNYSYTITRVASDVTEDSILRDENSGQIYLCATFKGKTSLYSYITISDDPDNYLMNIHSIACASRGPGSSGFNSQTWRSDGSGTYNVPITITGFKVKVHGISTGPFGSGKFSFYGVN